MADWGVTSPAGNSWGAGTGAASNFDDNAGTSTNDVDWGTGGAETQEADLAKLSVTDGFGQDNGDEVRDDICFGCGEPGHRRAECPNPTEMTCRYCKQPGHMLKDCPDKGPMICANCGEEGHMRKECEAPRKVNRDHIADVHPDEAWEKIKKAISERDVDDAKDAVQEYIKALEGKVTYRDLQQSFIDQNIGLWLIATERPLLPIFTNMNIQGFMGKKYSVSYRLNEKPDRPRELEGWPKDRDEILARLDDAGEVVDTGIPICMNCKELGHVSKNCPQEKMERDRTKPTCSNCGSEDHRLRDCGIARVDKFACKNCGKSGHKVADCEEPPNPANVECRKCNEIGHFAKDCPQGGGSRACRNCGQEGHMAKECDQPRNMDSVTCRNCEKTGHFSRECPEPKDWSKVQCSNCQEFGHTKVRCKQPAAELESYHDDNAGYANGDDGNVAAGGETTGDASWGAGNGAGGSTEETSQWGSGGW